jgi:hypothetical protein
MKTFLKYKKINLFMANNNDLEEVNELDVIYEAHDRIDALIELLIEKKVFSEKEFENKLSEIYKKNYED